MDATLSFVSTAQIPHLCGEDHVSDISIMLCMDTGSVSNATAATHMHDQVRNITGSLMFKFVCICSWG